MLADIGTVWILYAAAVYAIYKLGGILDDITSKEFRSEIGSRLASSDDLSSIVRRAVEQASVLVDKLLRFRSVYSFLYRPNPLRSLAVTSVLITFFSIPLLLLHGNDNLKDAFANLPYILLTVFPTCVLADYVSFSKSRTIIAFGSRLSNILALLAFIIIDLVLTYLIVMIIFNLSILYWRVAIWIYDPCASIANEHGWCRVLTITRFMTANWMFLWTTTIFITVVQMCVLLMNYILFVLIAHEALHSTVGKLLNLNEKPFTCAALFALLAFTLIYWAIVFGMGLIGPWYR